MKLHDDREMISAPLQVEQSDVHDGHVSSRCQYNLISQTLTRAGQEWRQGNSGTFYIAEIGIKFLRPIPHDEKNASIELSLLSLGSEGVCQMAGHIGADGRKYTKFSLTAAWRS
ncbi:hypothetical protein [Xanthomonas axonopodis]|uniref:hypothetical protein n=1 Tax=Xanthomonas axonopodis TaxID=53413 RepID=UPI00111712DE|nr:hypothetical protein [Xanthomonas axonopodis]